MLANLYQPVMDELARQLVEAYEDNEHDRIDKVVKQMGKVMRRWTHSFKEAFAYGGSTVMRI
jgi:hypothetical protein